jgi:3-hydroxy-9,10-secoandrosta-1,3,5(10)-triene-9,17-dione monooxygenase reductase component
MAFAVSGGDKFAGLNWTPASRGAPILAGSLGWVECELEVVHDAGDHELVLGRVMTVGKSDGTPLLYYRSKLGSMSLEA